MLTSHALAHKNVTFLNISPAPHTWPILEAQGYTRFGSGQFIAIPALAGGLLETQVRTVTPDIQPGDGLSPSEVELLVAHVPNTVVLAVTCDATDGRHPFVFGRR